MKRTLNPVIEQQNNIIKIQNKTYLTYASNDYLGLSQNKTIQAKLNITQWGSTGSRLLGGDHQCFHDLEHSLATFTQKQAALLFNSGYQLNSGIIPALYQKNDVIFADKYIHASFIDGISSSKAKLIRYKHSDTNHLETLLKTHRHKYKKAVILTESIFSMDGDIADIQALVLLKQRYKTELIIDEAHAIGVWGDSGQGVIPTQTNPQNVDMIIGTFGKAWASSGAFIACTNDIKNTLINTCRAFMYSTALPLPIIQWNQAVLDKIPQLTKQRQRLKKLSEYTRKQAQKADLNTRGNTHIIPIIIGAENKTETLSEKLKEKGYWVPAIRKPTVPENETRLRLALTTHHTIDNIDKLIKEITACLL